MRDTLLVESQNRGLAALVAHTLRYRDFFALPAAVPLPEDCAVRGIISIGYGKPSELLCRHLPLLALGEDAALLCSHYHGSVSAEEIPEEKLFLRFRNETLFEGMEDGEYRLRHVKEFHLPEKLIPIAESEKRSIAFRHETLPVYGVQYAIERNDPDAVQLLANFGRICGCSSDWQSEQFIDQEIAEIRSLLPEGMAVCAMSGGIDSTVSAALAYRALGGRLRCVYVDTGLGRRNEAEQAIRCFSESTGIPAAYLDARKEFMQALSGIRAETEKQRVISQTMREILRRRIAQEGDVKAIITGTTLNDLLYAPTGAEEGTESVSTICPVQFLFKEEVRNLGKYLELPESLIYRQPFPSSGLALRIWGEVGEHQLELLREADECFAAEIEDAVLGHKLFQYYASLADNPDGSSGYVVCLRAVQAMGNMGTAARLPMDVLERSAGRILEKLPEVKRVVYDLSPSVHYWELV